MTIGIKAAKASTFDNSFSNMVIIRAASIPPIKLAESHGARVVALDQVDLSKISLSLPAPAICRKSSVASSRITSIISSTVTIPTSL